MFKAKSQLAWLAAGVTVALPVLSACGGTADTPVPAATAMPTAMATDTTMMPGATDTMMPGATDTTMMPGATDTTMMPGATGTMMPGATGTMMPGATGTMMSGTTTPAASGGVNTTTALAQLATEGITPDTTANGQLEFFSWWTAGGEAEGKNDILSLYKALYPNVQVIDAAVAGGGGDNAKAVLATRMQANNPPDTFQVHAGPELLAGYVAPGLMQPVTDIYNQMNIKGDFPQQLLNIISVGNDIYSVPADIHRGNVLFYNKKLLSDNNLQAPTTWDQFFTDADALKAKGVPALAIGGKDTWSVTMLFEDILLTTAGPDKYNDLMQGKAQWTDPTVVSALDTLKKIWQGGYINTDQAALTWDEAANLVQNGKAGMQIMGDWAKGNFQSVDPTGWSNTIGWEPSPGTTGIFKVISDSFGLPKGAKDTTNVTNFLKLLASKTGQVTFNLRKGSIPARTDVDTSQFDVYMKSANADFTSAQHIVGSAPHGSATTNAFASALTTAINSFVANPGDSSQAAAGIQSQAADLIK